MWYHEMILCDLMVTKGNNDINYDILEVYIALTYYIINMLPPRYTTFNIKIHTISHFA